MRSVVSVLFFVLASALYGQVTPCVSRPSVSVTGSASIRLLPDRVSFSVGVETEAKSVAAAFQQNNAKLNAVVAALEKAGVLPNEIQTSTFYLTSRDEEQKKLQGYRVSNSVTVTRSGTADVSGVLQAAVDAGATEAGNLRFFVFDPKKAQMNGLELAFKDARAKGEKLAALSGKTLGDVISTTDQVYGGGYSAASPMPPVAEAITVTAAEAPTVQAGEQYLGFSVAVVFELK